VKLINDGFKLGTASVTIGVPFALERKTNIVIKGERADFDSLRVPQGPGISRESVATVMIGTRWNRCLRKRGLWRAQMIQHVEY